MEWAFAKMCQLWEGSRFWMCYIFDAFRLEASTKNPAVCQVLYIQYLHCTDKGSEALEVMHLQGLDHVPPGLGFEPRLPLQGFVTVRSTGH